MPPDETHPIAENGVSKEAQDAVTLAAATAAATAAYLAAQDTPLTKEEFAAQMQRLTERARAAGLNPIKTMAQAYAKQGLAILDSLLASLESNDSSKKKKE